jgi:hypothetical protein
MLVQAAKIWLIAMIKATHFIQEQVQGVKARSWLNTLLRGV